MAVSKDIEMKVLDSLDDYKNFKTLNKFMREVGTEVIENSRTDLDIIHFGDKIKDSSYVSDSIIRSIVENTGSKKEDVLSELFILDSEISMNKDIAKKEYNNSDKYTDYLIYNHKDLSTDDIEYVKMYIESIDIFVLSSPDKFEYDRMYEYIEKMNKSLEAQKVIINILVSLYNSVENEELKYMMENDIKYIIKDRHYTRMASLIFKYSEIIDQIAKTNIE